MICAGLKYLTELIYFCGQINILHMKKLALIFLVVIIAAPAFSQTKPPKKTRKALLSMVPDARDVKWTTANEREIYKNRIWTANYTLEGDSVLSRFDYKSNWLVTLSFIPVSELPEAVVASIEDSYTRADLIKAAKYKDPDFEGFGVAFLYKEDKWSVQISKEGEIVRRRLQGEGFAFD